MIYQAERAPFGLAMRGSSGGLRFGMPKYQMVKVCCRRCKSDHVRRSQSGVVATLLNIVGISSVLGYKPFRCRGCSRLFWVKTALARRKADVLAVQ